MTSEALQNPYFVRLYCKNIDKTHSLTEPNDKIQFLQKRGESLWKGGGGRPPVPPPPLNPPLASDGDREVLLKYEFSHDTQIAADN